MLQRTYCFQAVPLVVHADRTDVFRPDFRQIIYLSIFLTFIQL